MKFFIEYIGFNKPEEKWFVHFADNGGAVCSENYKLGLYFDTEQQAWDLIDNEDELSRVYFKVTPLELK